MTCRFVSLIFRNSLKFLSYIAIQDLESEIILSVIMENISSMTCCQLCSFSCSWSSHHKSLADVFDNISITPADRNSLTFIDAPTFMKYIILNILRKKKTSNWTSFISKNIISESFLWLFFTIKVDFKTRAYILIGKSASEKLFHKIIAFFQSIQEKIDKQDDDLKIVSKNANKANDQCHLW